MPIARLPLGTLGPIETSGTVTFGLWLPWVSASAGAGLKDVATLQDTTLTIPSNHGRIWTTVSYKNVVTRQTKL